MRVSIDWLRDYVEISLSPEELADRLTRAGLETESIERIGDDVVLELETTSNRPDHLGHLGVAREVAWICRVPLRTPDDGLGTVPTAAGKSLSEWVRLHVEDRVRCPRYIARLAIDVRIEESPAWLKRRLETIGLRPVNNVVDLSNYVLHEWGQPLHTFDHELLEGGMILVRRAAQGEAITAINGREYLLDREDLVIADQGKPVAVAGIMGGVDSEVCATTRCILLESAWFDPVSIRRSSRRLALASDSSYRFERRVDPEGVESASRRFCHLLQKICGATILEGALDELEPSLLEEARRVVPVRPARASHLLGVEIGAEEISSGLGALGFERIGGEGGRLDFRTPSYRGDVSREVDLIEEVARVHGFEEIPEDNLTVFPAPRSSRERLVEGVRAWMVGAGYHEALTFSFAREDDHSAIEAWWCEAAPYEIRNPMRNDERLLRRSLLPGLLRALRGNRLGGVGEVRLFEVSRVYHRLLGGERPQEALHLAWVAAVPGFEFRDVRGVADGILDYLRVPAIPWSPLAAPCGLAPGRAAALEQGGGRLGLAGAIELKGVTELSWCGEISLDPLLDLGIETRVYQEFSRLPGIRRDLNVVVGEELLWSEIEEELRAAGLEDLVRIDFTDLYQGKQVPDGKKSVTCSLLFKSDDRTLTNAEADERTERALTRLAERFGARLR
ncbi:MAG: phenylalanine--tRNA ligase subunit beta [Planctomycetota bacterium]